MSETLSNLFRNINTNSEGHFKYEAELKLMIIYTLCATYLHKIKTYNVTSDSENTND